MGMDARGKGGRARILEAHVRERYSWTRGGFRTKKDPESF